MKKSFQKALFRKKNFSSVSLNLIFFYNFKVLAHYWDKKPFLKNVELNEQLNKTLPYKNQQEKPCNEYTNQLPA